MSQKIILCHNTQLNKLEGLEKKKSVRTKEFPIRTKIARDSKKSCCDRVDRLKSKCLS